MDFLGSSVGKESTCNIGHPSSISGSGRSPGEGRSYPLQYSWTSLVAETVKNSPAMQETQVWSLGWEDPLEEGMVTHSIILPWRIPMDRGAWRATVHGVAESDTTEWLNTAQHEYFVYMKLCICLFPTGVFHSALCPQGWLFLLVLLFEGYMIVLCVSVPYSVYLFMHWWSLGLLLPFGFCEWNCSECGCIHKCLFKMQTTFSSLGHSTEVKLMDHAVLFLILWGTAILFSIKCWQISRGLSRGNHGYPSIVGQTL